MAFKSKPRDYPLFYHQIHGASDRDWILKRMAAIPADRKNEVSCEYERLFLSQVPGNRKAANTYLHNEAKKYRGTK